MPARDDYEIYEIPTSPWSAGRRCAPPGSPTRPTARSTPTRATRSCTRPGTRAGTGRTSGSSGRTWPSTRPSGSSSCRTCWATGCRRRRRTPRRPTTACASHGSTSATTSSPSTAWSPSTSGSSGWRWCWVGRWARDRPTSGRSATRRWCRARCRSAARSRTSPHNIVFLEGVKGASPADGAFRGGWYDGQPVTGLRAAGAGLRRLGILPGVLLGRGVARDGLHLAGGFPRRVLGGLLPRRP